MATSTKKKKGETSTTVSVGVRIDPRIKFALDIMGRIQKRSLTAVIEWAISKAIAEQRVEGSDADTVGSLVDKVWSTDESTRFAKLCFYLPHGLSYDELRIWDTIKASQLFWVNYVEDTHNPYPSHFDFSGLREHWEKLLEHVEEHKNSGTIKPYWDDPPF